MLQRLKERFLGDERTLGAVAELKSLYDAAEDPEAFHEAMTQGDIESAADHHPLSSDELHDRVDGMMDLGDGLAEDYSEIRDKEPEEFINA